MKKSESKLTAMDDATDEQIKEYYKEAALDALLYWTNTTTQLAGSNTSLTLLTEMLGTCITQLIPEDKAESAREIILDMIETSFTQIQKKDTQVSKKSSDKRNMN